MFFADQGFDFAANQAQEGCAVDDGFDNFLECQSKFFFSNFVAQGGIFSRPDGSIGLGFIMVSLCDALWQIALLDQPTHQQG